MVTTHRSPLLEGRRLAWGIALASAGVIAVFVLTERLRPWVGALTHVGALSLVTLALFAWDKRRAGKDARRISESNLLWLAVLGGAAGAWVGMWRGRHKTRRLRFRILVPLAVLLHAGAIAWLAVRA